MFLKAQKCFFGYSEIDFVGKVLSEEGLKMSQLKIESVLDFPQPVVSKQLKKILESSTIFGTLLEMLRQLSSRYMAS